MWSKLSINLFFCKLLKYTPKVSPSDKSGPVNQRIIMNPVRELLYRAIQQKRLDGKTSRRNLLVGVYITT